jgi:hypothetical protein
MAYYPLLISDIPDRSAYLDGTGAGEAHSVIHDAIKEEIDAIATELGVQPSGPDVTVVARLDRIEGDVDDLETATTRDTQALINLAPNVINYGSPYPNAYSSRSNGLVVLAGLLQNNSGGAISAGTAIGQVHASHIPAATEVFASLLGNDTVIRLDVEMTTGQIRLVGSAWPDQGYISLSGITYIAV